MASSRSVPPVLGALLADDTLLGSSCLWERESIVEVWTSMDRRAIVAVLRSIALTSIAYREPMAIGLWEVLRSCASIARTAVGRHRDGLQGQNV